MTAGSVATDPVLDLDYRAHLPQRRDIGIGIVGAGAIVRLAHLPAYQLAGFRVSAITDINAEAAEAAAGDFGIPNVSSSAEDLINRSDVAIVDIAVPPAAQVDIALAAMSAGKSVLCQKPLALEVADAERIAETAVRTGTRVAVNQQLRWGQAIRSIKDLIRKGWLGEVTGGLFDVDVLSDWNMWPWIVGQPRLDYTYHSIHYLDATRFLLGEPRGVMAHVSRFPGQAALGESRTVTVLDYADTCSVTILVDHNNRFDPRAVVRVQGTEGRATATLGLNYDYPVGRPDTLSFASLTRYPGTVFEKTFKERWVPDSFIGPMAELMASIEEEREPNTSARDNLGTLRLVDAAYRSAASGQRVSLAGS